MQLGPLTAGEAFGYLISGACLLVALWTRAAVSDLRAEIAERQAARCNDCKKELVSRGEFIQMEKRLELAAQPEAHHG